MRSRSACTSSSERAVDVSRSVSLSPTSSVPPRTTEARHKGAWLCGAAIASVTVWWVATSPTMLLRDTLRASEFWILEFLFGALVGLTVYAVLGLARALTRGELLVMGVLALSAVALVSVAPGTSRIYYDEQIYQSVGQNMSDLHLAQMCNDGTVEYGSLQCWRSDTNKQPVRLSVPAKRRIQDLRDFRNSTASAQRVDGGGTAVVVFLIVRIATGDGEAAAFGGLALILIPEQLRWSHSGASEPSTAFFCALAMLAVIAFCRAPSRWTFAWMAVSSSVAACFRAEAVLIVPVVIVGVVMTRPRAIFEAQYEWLVVAWMIMLIPETVHLAAVRGESWGAPGDRMSLAFLSSNLAANASFYISDHRFPGVLTLLALAGLSRSRLAGLLGFWFVTFWGVFVLFYAGSYNYGADVRYSLLSYAPLAAFAGLGASRIARALGGMLLRPRRPIAAVAGLLIVQFLMVRAVGA